METFFAPAERADEQVLQQQVEWVHNSPLINGLMRVSGGLLAVLNEQRQILALNDALLTALGLDDAGVTLGLRLGQAVGCIHANCPPNGCGTTEFCVTCGAAIAMVSSLAQGEPVERNCVVSIERDGLPQEVFFAVRSCPIQVNGARLLLIFLVDTTRQQQQSVLERVFYHDINNIVTGLLGLSSLLVEDPLIASDVVPQLYYLSERLAQEIAIQRYLSQSRLDGWTPKLTVVLVSDVLVELERTFAAHTAARGRQLELTPIYPDLMIQTNLPLLLRVLGNLVTNALEATPPGGQVRVWVETAPDTVIWKVWNAQAIPPDVAKRVFQRYFSTKQESGRGLGTFSARLFGTQFLGGQVSFTTSPEQGTVFQLALPLRPRPGSVEANR